MTEPRVVEGGSGLTTVLRAALPSLPVVNLLPVENSYSVEAISDTPIFNALAATTAPFSQPSAEQMSHALPVRDVEILGTTPTFSEEFEKRAA